MAKNDYHVVVFRILAYLYKLLKAGNPVDPDMLRPDSKICEVNEMYWKYIVVNMQKEGLTSGLVNYDHLEDQLANIQITPKGIELLCDNRLRDRVDQLLQGILKIS